ncbi:hypothetical protein Tco_1269922, partial [Tanacetum coccineum]
KDKKDKSEQNQSKPTRNGKGKTKSEDGKTIKAGSARYSKKGKLMKIKGFIMSACPPTSSSSYAPANILVLSSIRDTFGRVNVVPDIEKRTKIKTKPDTSDHAIGKST